MNKNIKCIVFFLCGSFVTFTGATILDIHPQMQVLGKMLMLFGILSALVVPVVIYLDDP